MAEPNVARKTDRGEGTRITRGIELYRNHDAEIVVYLDDTYGVPSSTTEDFVYHVDLEAEECECPDNAYRRARCMHIVAATIKRAKTRSTERSREKTPARVCRRARAAA